MTTIIKAIKKFEVLKEGAQSFKDTVYLNGVLAVLDSLKNDEKEMIEQAHMAGQFDAGVAPSAYNALVYYENKINPPKMYELLKDYENPCHIVRGGVQKTEYEWTKIFTGLTKGDCEIKKDWFKEIKL